MIAETLRWWLVIQGIGLIGLPIAFVLFRSLPDRGYAFAKPVGILLGAYLFWLALSLHVLPNRPGSIVWVYVLLTGISALILRASKDEMIAALKERANVLLAVEVLFLLALVVGVYLRSYIPEIDGTEKPMDFMLVNAASRSRFYPPDDPWLAGAHVSYYYFGYVIQAMLGKLAAVPTSVAFNLGLASTAALASITAFSLGFNLSRFSRFVTEGRAIAIGLAAVVLVVLIGNLEGVVEFAIANGIVSSGLVHSMHIAGLDQAQRSTACLVSIPGCIEYPNESSSFWWWWRATRLSPDGNSITEFPFFSFLLGDLHPHVMALPYVLTSIGMGLSFWRSEGPLSFDTWRGRTAALLGAAILLGALGFLNTWDLPTIAFVVGVLALARNLQLLREDDDGLQPLLRRAIIATSGFLMPLVVLAVVAYAPFYLSFSSQASGLETVTSAATKPLHAALFWAPLLVVSLPLPIDVLWRNRARLKDVTWAILPPLALLLLWLLVSALKGHGAMDAIEARGANWLTTLFYAASLACCLGALWLAVNNEGDDDAIVPVLVLTTTGLLLILGGELFFVKDVFGTRLNTVFKLSYQAWLLLAVSGGYGIHRFVGEWRVRNVEETVASGRRSSVWAGVTAFVLALALLYPLGATLSRTRDAQNPQRTLDGLAFARSQLTDEYVVIDWLRTHAGANERIMELPGGQYSAGDRASAWTGVPTVIGWGGHEIQWGRSGTAIAARQADVDKAYSTDSLDEALQILQKYDVTYIYVGLQERTKYQPQSLAKFEAFESVIRNGAAVLYRVPKAGIDSEITTQGAP